MRVKPFTFKKFHIHHSQCAHKVGTDGVLLGAWAAHESPKKILDVGSGSGLVSFMLAQRNPQATIWGIDQHEPSVKQAQLSLAEGPFATRGSFLNTDFLKWSSPEKFDLIVSNPPFFAAAQNTSQPQRDAARRQFSLPHQAMLTKMEKHLSTKGSICLILPTTEAMVLSDFAPNIGLHLSKLCTVSSFPSSTVIRHLMTFSRESNPLEQEHLAIREAPEQWSEAYSALTNDFHP
jgi:tRNA1Val (adenine37-N6)-methyltransferase